MAKTRRQLRDDIAQEIVRTRASRTDDLGTAEMRAEISKRATALINLKIWNIVQIRKSLADPDGRMPMSDSEAVLRYD